MPEMGDTEEAWAVDCSDDDSNTSSKKLGPEPPTSEFIKLFDSLDSNGPVPISWKWPHGRRAPTDSSGFIEEDVEEAEETKIEEKSDFDFMDEAATPVLRKEKASGPKGSAKKKTSSFSGIISNIKRHRQQEQMEKVKSLTVRNKR